MSSPGGKTARAVAHPNIALAKYWGKKAAPGNVPAVPSLSVTLAGMCTTTEVSFDDALASDAFTLNGAPAAAAPLARTTELLDRVRALAGIRTRARVHSANDFPTASGLASSASGFAALALAATRAAGLDLAPSQVARVARQSSASAARSLFGGFAELDTEGETRAVAPAAQLDLHVLVCVTSELEKAVASTSGMLETAKKSPYYASWLDAAPRIFADVKAALLARDFERLGEATEASAFAMHASAMAAGIVYFNAGTLAALEAVRELRKGGALAYATMDAGPHVKVLVLGGDRERVLERMQKVEGVLRVLETRPGNAASVEAS